MKKVLIISYYWPPSGGPGVQRVLKFVKYLPEFGWHPIILTVENGNYPSIDNTLEKDIPKICRVYKTKIFEPTSLYKKITNKNANEAIPTFVLNKSENESIVNKISRWIRANMYVPDAKTSWIKYIHEEGMKIIKEELPDIIFSSSPPHSLQIGAYKLAKDSGLKWVADFRDPWSNSFWQADLNRTKLASIRDKKLEKQVLSSCSAVTTVSHSIAKMFNEICPNKYSIIPNGFDEADFKPGNPNNSKFKISYTGTLGKDQPVNDFLISVKKLPDVVKQKMEIHFYGTFHDLIIKSVEKYFLTKLVTFHEQVSHAETVNIIQNSDMLLLVIPKTPKNEGILTGKLFEYMITGNYILGLGPVEGDAARILKDSGCGEMFDFGTDLTTILFDKITDWQAGKRFENNLDEVRKYSRRSLTQKLATLFEELV
jgi:glycosyltransferase involved in cell wall biosynthesis